MRKKTELGLILCFLLFLFLSLLTGVSAVKAKAADVSDYNGRRLSGLNREAYEQIRTHIAAVAGGERSDTAFQITFEISEYADRQWTAEELGIDSLVKETEDGLVISDDDRVIIRTKLGKARKIKGFALI